MITDMAVFQRCSAVSGFKQQTPVLREPQTRRNKGETLPTQTSVTIQSPLDVAVISAVSESVSGVSGPRASSRIRIPEIPRRHHFSDERRDNATLELRLAGRLTIVA